MPLKGMFPASDKRRPITQPASPSYLAILVHLVDRMDYQYLVRRTAREPLIFTTSMSDVDEVTVILLGLLLYKALICPI